MKIITIAFISIVAITFGQAMAEKLAADAIYLAVDVVTMPQGRIMLISRNGFLGAIKFIENDERPDGWYSKYEYYVQKGDGFKKQEEGYICYKKMIWNWWNKILYHYLQLHPNPYDYADRLLFDKFELIATAGTTHSSVYFWSKVKVIDHKVRLAPTPWRDISEVNMNDRKLKWFMHDEKRQRLIIHIDKLWD